MDNNLLILNVQSRMKSKVLIVATTFLRWENDRLPSFIYNFARSIKVKYEIHILTPHSRGARKYEVMDDIKVHRFVYAPEKLEKFGSGISIVSTIKSNPITLFLIPFFVISAAFKMTELQIKNKYDVIHVNWMVPFGPVVGFLRMLTEFRYVITSHGSDVFPFVSNTRILTFFVSWLHKTLTLPNVDRIVPVSKSLSAAIIQLFPDVPQDKISVISMGIDYYGFSNKKQRVSLQKPLKIVFVGRLDEIKGVIYLINAMSILKKKSIDFELQIYGDGLLRKSLEDQVNKLELADRITFNGFVEHKVLAKMLTEADIFVGPSITTTIGEAEGFGLVFLEAMAAGLVVIGSNVGGITDIVIDRKTGILVEEKNPDAIAEAIDLVIKDDGLRKEIIRNGKDFAKKYDWASVAEKYFEIYKIGE